MKQTPKEKLLARLAGRAGNEEGNAWAEIEARAPEHGLDEGPRVVGEVSEQDAELDKILEQINQLTDQNPPAEEAERSEPHADSKGFLPIEPTSLEETGLTPSEVEALIMKMLMARGEATGHGVAEHIRLPFLMVNDLLERMKRDQLVFHKSAAAMNDFIYQLTEVGRELARLHTQQSTYFGAAPVDIEDYIAAVHAQSLTNQRPTMDDLQRAFEDLLVNKRMLHRIGPAINSGRGMFLFGPPGNGKSSIAERITVAFGETIWIPRALYIHGEIIRLYDANHHRERPLEDSSGLLDNRRVDRRWIRITRPTIVVGGELTMTNLEIASSPTTGVSEAPVQLKSNCGTLVIDDFGRQRMSTDELLNRWIVPLEKQVDFLNLVNGKKIEVPFDQLIVFSTNLEPRDLVDDAFLRRIPYKIEIKDPSEQEFRDLFELMAPKVGIPVRPEVIDYLIKTHYAGTGRPFRFCHPRDLLTQIRNFCRFTDSEPDMTTELFDMAVENYFAVM